uniref:Uncharacterized protein n=1 Tax=Arundo donax TaxID=35708 RepID=A0A0A8XNJ5_ARUDO
MKEGALFGFAMVKSEFVVVGLRLERNLMLRRCHVRIYCGCVVGDGVVGGLFTV